MFYLKLFVFNLEIISYSRTESEYRVFITRITCLCECRSHLSDISGRYTPKYQPKKIYIFLAVNYFVTHHL